MEPKLFVCFAKLGKLYLGRLFDFFAQRLDSVEVKQFKNMVHCSIKTDAKGGGLVSINSLAHLN